MIITKLIGGLGNQLFQYAAGRSIAEIHDTGLLLDITGFDDYSLYSLDKIIEKFEDKNLIKSVQKLENSIYGHTGNLDWKGEKLAIALTGLPKLNKKAKQSKSDLPEIYPI